MKAKQTLSAIAAFWILFVAFEGASSFIRYLYSGKMHKAMRAVSSFVNGIKLALMVALAISNVLLFIKHVDDGEKEKTY